MLNQGTKINSSILIITISGANPFTALTILSKLSSDCSNLKRITNFDLR
jgi:hypothetical protein